MESKQIKKNIHDVKCCKCNKIFTVWEEKNSIRGCLDLETGKVDNRKAVTISRDGRWMNVIGIGCRWVCNDCFEIERLKQEIVRREKALKEENKRLSKMSDTERFIEELDKAFQEEMK